MSPEFYKREANRVRLLAADTTDRASTDRLLRLAAEYEDIAEELDGSMRFSGMSVDRRDTRGAER